MFCVQGNLAWRSARSSNFPPHRRQVVALEIRTTRNGSTGDLLSRFMSSLVSWVSAEKAWWFKTCKFSISSLTSAAVIDVLDSMQEKRAITSQYCGSSWRRLAVANSILLRTDTSFTTEPTSSIASVQPEALGNLTPCDCIAI